MDLNIVLQNVDEHGVHMGEGGEPPDATVQKIAASLLWLGELKDVSAKLAKAPRKPAARKSASKKTATLAK